jgi:hypothetical protein
MSEPGKKRCIVLLPSGPHFERLFDEVLERAITKTGLVPSRLYWNAFAPTPIHLFVDEIEQAEAVVADISEHTDEIWLAVGCAIALRRPLCLISSAMESNLPPGIQYLPHISYPVDAFPTDYVDLQYNIYAQLSAVVPQPNAPLPEPPHRAPHPPPSPAPAPSAPASSALASSAPASSEDLASYEVMAMTILDIKASATGLSPRDLGLEMQACNAAALTSHAMNALKRRRFIETRPVQVSAGSELHLSENLFLTRTGEDWLIRQGKRVTTPRNNARTRARFLSTT